MISPNHINDRESLSALFDGELQGDQLRFAHKRLAQDVQWRQACGSWQLIGDVLRGQATAAAPADFSDRVQRELAREAAAELLVPAVAVGAPSRRGWIGGAALAASVAVAAWFVTVPTERVAPQGGPATSMVNSTPPAAAPGLPVQSSPPAVAMSDARPGQDRRASRAPEPRVAVRNAREVGTSAVAARVSAPVSAPPFAPTAATQGSDPVSGIQTPALDATALADPFRLPSSPVGVPRPWPRAVLPGYPEGALTARYGGRPQNSQLDLSETDSPTFYPFEPRLPPDAGAAASADGRGP